ncbi:hypothetical protein QJS10_CPB11g01219 [Acorus calamus]|uniref:Uncharacterized protein n=1 Tax=Acorus calamus TaxID=4465 RepID=A0AAV9DV28_ACOCL|nr:hypothetical protein QJS10_CPB11g01219 [Acorus calamus]
MGSLEGEVLEGRDSFVVDVERLSVTVSDKDSISNPTISKTLSRKGSQRVEKKAAPEADSPPHKGDAVGVRDKALIVVHQAQIASDPSVTNQAEVKPRKHGRRSPTSFVDPRRVLVFFATLSSLGTLILLYFTLSMGRMGGDDASSSAR